jgi:predicted transcriptional regulator
VHSKRSASFLAAEAIAAYVEREEWQIGEVQAGIAELDAGKGFSQKRVAEWVRSWGTATEKKSAAMNAVWSPGQQEVFVTARLRSRLPGN